MDNISEEIYIYTIRQMKLDGSSARAAYRDALKTTIADFQRQGLLTDDDNTILIEDKLARSWEQALRDLAY